MLPLLVAVAWGQLVSRPLWFVSDFVDLTRRGNELGKVAAATLAENLTRDHDVASEAWDFAPSRTDHERRSGGP